MILCLISDRFMIKILVGVELQQRIWSLHGLIQRVIGSCVDQVKKMRSLQVKTSRRWRLVS